jgi:riboflavin kinase/FMN adenylyltransferase
MAGWRRGRWLGDRTHEMAEILIGSDKARSKRGPCVVTVGAFDGVHVGHQDIVRTAIATARDRGVSSCVVTFDPHPAAYAGIEGFRYLTSLDDRLEYLDATGVDVIRVLPFDADLAKTPPDEYIRDVLVGGLGAVAVVVGATHRFGRGGKGDVALLDHMSAHLAFTVQLVPATLWNGEIISSSRIREAVSDGRMADARDMLGRPYSLLGEVVEGDHRGVGLGFPTANLAPPSRRVLPALGIYAAIAEVGGTAYPAGVHVGPVPTFGCEKPTIEAHLLDFEGDLVGRRLRLSFLRRLRGIVRFDNREELARQIGQDLDLVRSVVADHQ